MTLVTEETARRIAAALERLAAVVEAQSAKARAIVVSQTSESVTVCPMNE